MKVIVFLVLIVQCFASYDDLRVNPAEYDLGFYDYFKPQEDYSPCKQEVPNCAKCLRKRSCTWCIDSAEAGGVCKSTRQCPSRHQLTCQENDPEDQLKDLYQVDRSYVLDVKEVTLNASYLCHLKTNCSTCTKLEFCAWCKTKHSCIPYSGAATTESCGSKSWYKNQCTYSGFITPCHKRKPNCKDCTSDDVCYWCASSKVCGYYPRDGFQPTNCSTDQWYYKHCSRVKEFIILLPIILFLSTPVLAYVIMYFIICLLKKDGYIALDDSDTSDDDDDDMKRRPIMLRHGSPADKTDKLRKKYNLDKKP